MSGPLKAAWGLTAFVVVAGVVLWLVTGRAERGARATARPTTRPTTRKEDS